MKIFISQPMNNKTYNQIKLERMDLVQKLEKQGYKVIETVFENLDLSKSPIYYLGIAIELLSEADIVIFMNGWENARGCRIEMQIAKDYGKEILILKERK